MRRPYARLATACALAVATTIFAGGALAGNGNGKENAPGQLKKAQEQQSASAQAQAGAQATASVNAGATATDSAPGVKPDNSTSKWTQCTTGGTPAAATCTAISPTPNTKPDVSKRYGNGKTAAQIAVGRGASAVKLTGPGNSQPHKVSDCRHKANRSGGVDVHAVKSYSATCQAATTTASTQATAQVTSQAAASVQATVSAQQSATPAAQASAAAAQATPAAQAGVLGAQTTLSSPKSSNGSVQGTALPFTGFPLWPAVLIGLSLIGAGLTVRRRSAASRL